MSPVVLRLLAYRLYFFSREGGAHTCTFSMRLAKRGSGWSPVWSWREMTVSRRLALRPRYGSFASTSMNSARRGIGTFPLEVSNVSREGFSLLIGRKTRFVRFEDFPWFRDASIAQLTNVTLQSPHHLHWPDLDVDLAVESLDHPERYPLVSRVPAATRAMPRRSMVKERARTYRAKQRP